MVVAYFIMFVPHHTTRIVGEWIDEHELNQYIILSFFFDLIIIGPVLDMVD